MRQRLRGREADRDTEQSSERGKRLQSAPGCRKGDDVDSEREESVVQDALNLGM